MKFLVVVTPPYIYHGCSTWKTFWEEKFTGKQDLFQSVNKKNCGRRKVSKHKDIKGSDKCVTWNISEKFDSLNNMETISSDSKVELGRSGKGLVTSLDLKTKARQKKHKKARYAIGNVNMKDLSNIIKEFEKIVKVTYVKRILKHEPTSSYYHLVGCITECMLICGEDNHHMHDVHAGYEEEMTPSSNVNDTDEDESEEYIVNEPFDEPSSENLSIDVSESECNIVNKNLPQNNSSDVPTNIITELKYDEHIEPSVSYKGSSYFNIFERINIHSRYPPNQQQYQKYIINYLQHKRDSMI